MHTVSIKRLVRRKTADYAMLFKLRLSSIVVFSAVIGYAVSVETIYLVNIFLVALGGFLVTGSSNTINQIIEKDTDRLMDRTKNRPLASNRMNVLEAVLFAGITGIGGIALLTLQFNTLTGLLAALSLLMYGFVYTPFKRISPIAVFIGAIPGALPPLIGAVAAVNRIEQFGVFLFVIQFIWQFPHFWAIAWVSYDDYQKAGIMLLPSTKGKDKITACQSMIYAFLLIPVSFLSYKMDLLSLEASALLTLVSLAFFFFAVRFLQKVDDASAKHLMFASFFYLPIAFLVVLFF